MVRAERALLLGRVVFLRSKKMIWLPENSNLNGTWISLARRFADCAW